MLTVSAWALPTDDYLLKTYEHEYGIGKVDPLGTDVLSNDYVTVSDKSAVRFYDSFDFSDLNFSSITQFDLTLTYSNIGNYLFGFGEFWHVRPGGLNHPIKFRLFPDGNNGDFATYTIYSDFDPQFSNMVENGIFDFSFAEETLFADNFKLYSAILDIYGTDDSFVASADDDVAPVPEPGTMMLFGVGMLGLVVFGKRRMSKQA